MAMGADTFGRRGWTRRAALSLIAACALALAACGGGGGADGAPAPPVGPASSPQLSPATTIAGPDGATLRLPEGALALPAPTVRIAKDGARRRRCRPCSRPPATFSPSVPTAPRCRRSAPCASRSTRRRPTTRRSRSPRAMRAGGWTLRTDARIDGAMLEIEVARLGHSASSGRRRTSPRRPRASTGRRPQKYVAWTYAGIRLARPASSTSKWPPTSPAPWRSCISRCLPGIERGRLSRRRLRVCGQGF